MGMNLTSCNSSSFSNLQQSSSFQQPSSVSSGGIFSPLRIIPRDTKTLQMQFRNQTAVVRQTGIQILTNTAKDAFNYAKKEASNFFSSWFDPVEQTTPSLSENATRQEKHQRRQDVRQIDAREKKKREQTSPPYKALKTDSASLSEKQSKLEISSQQTPFVSRRSSPTPAGSTSLGARQKTKITTTRTQKEEATSVSPFEQSKETNNARIFEKNAKDCHDVHEKITDANNFRLMEKHKRGLLNIEKKMALQNRLVPLEMKKEFSNVNTKIREEIETLKKEINELERKNKIDNFRLDRSFENTRKEIEKRNLSKKCVFDLSSPYVKPKPDPKMESLFCEQRMEMIERSHTWALLSKRYERKRYENDLNALNAQMQGLECNTRGSAQCEENNLKRLQINEQKETLKALFEDKTARIDTCFVGIKKDINSECHFSKYGKKQLINLEEVCAFSGNITQIDCNEAQECKVKILVHKNFLDFEHVIVLRGKETRITREIDALRMETQQDKTQSEANLKKIQELKMERSESINRIHEIHKDAFEIKLHLAEQLKLQCPSNIEISINYDFDVNLLNKLKQIQCEKHVETLKLLSSFATAVENDFFSILKIFDERVKNEKADVNKDEYIGGSLQEASKEKYNELTTLSGYMSIIYRQFRDEITMSCNKDLESIYSVVPNIKNPPLKKVRDRYYDDLKVTACTLLPFFSVLCGYYTLYRFFNDNSNAIGNSIENDIIKETIGISIIKTGSSDIIKEMNGTIKKTQSNKHKKGFTVECARNINQSREEIELNHKSTLNELYLMLQALEEKKPNEDNDAILSSALRSIYSFKAFINKEKRNAVEIILMDECNDNNANDQGIKDCLDVKENDLKDEILKDDIFKDDVHKENDFDEYRKKRRSSKTLSVTFSNEMKIQTQTQKYHLDSSYFNSINETEMSEKDMIKCMDMDKKDLKISFCEDIKSHLEVTVIGHPYRRNGPYRLRNIKRKTSYLNMNSDEIVIKNKV